MSHLRRELETREADIDAARAFLDYFCCPPECAPFDVSGKLSAAAGFFRFGSARCYGKTAGQPARTASEDLFDAAPAIGISAGRISLSFNPTEVIENLRRERYLSTTDYERRFRSLYYLLRPILPISVRRLLQRCQFRWRRGNFPTWPVDRSVEQIFESLMQLAIRATGEREIPFVWFWPEGKNAAVMMSHDVEEEDGAAHCELLMDLDDRFGVKASFQLVPEGRYSGVEQLVAHIRKRGFETNIHDLDHDGRLYEHEQRFQQRARKINAYARMYAMEGFRAGSMHRNQDWFDLLEFQYEMSVPNVSHLEPQAGGCCTVTPFFVGRLLELPLTMLQDHGLFNILGEQSIDLWKQQIEIISAHHGLISFIIHPDYIVRAGERGLYLELLEYISRLRDGGDIWLALPGEINRWWRERSQMRLVREGERWQVRGLGSERARLAYASLVDGKLQYRVANPHAVRSAEGTPAR
ncbi:MAG: hypothetical protein ABSG52_07925 [Terriglobales bacterium]|jgi:hypothetical protein